MMDRNACFRIIARHVTDEVVIPVYSAAFEWLAINPRALNHYSVGAMGLASSHALGIALGQPGRRVIVLDGDGSLLMNIGSLVTIAAAAPENLVHFVCQNGTYEANGGHPLPNRQVNFAGLARAAGYPHVHEFSDLTQFEAQAAHVLAQQGPVFATLHLMPSGPLNYDYDDLYDARRREEFRAALQRPA
jgi:phosphonopyruvate decarboxylase